MHGFCSGRDLKLLQQTSNFESADLSIIDKSSSNRVERESRVTFWLLCRYWSFRYYNIMIPQAIYHLKIRTITLYQSSASAWFYIALLGTDKYFWDSIWYYYMVKLSLYMIKSSFYLSETFSLLKCIVLECNFARFCCAYPVINCSMSHGHYVLWASLKV